MHSYMSWTEGAMDTFARGLKSAAAIIEDDVLPGMVN